MAWWFWRDVGGVEGDGVGAGEVAWVYWVFFFGFVEVWEICWWRWEVRGVRGVSRAAGGWG